MRIPFNKPYLTRKETHYIEDAVRSGKISGNREYTKKCQQFFIKNTDSKIKVIITNIYHFWIGYGNQYQ